MGDVFRTSLGQCTNILEQDTEMIKKVDGNFLFKLHLI